MEERDELATSTENLRPVLASLSQRYQSGECNCVGLYRKVIVFRRSLLGRGSPSEFSVGTLVGVITWSKAKGGFVEEIPADRPDSDSLQTRRNRMVGIVETIPDDLWEMWGDLSYVVPGRPTLGMSRLLFLDAVILGLCPNGFQHLLGDALTLKLNEISLPGSDYEKAKLLKQAVKWAATAAGRAWIAAGWEVERPRRLWWLRPAAISLHVSQRELSGIVATTQRKASSNRGG